MWKSINCVFNGIQTEHIAVLCAFIYMCNALLTLTNIIIIPPLPEGVGGYTVLPLSVRPSKIFFVAFFSVTVDGRNLIFGHKRHIGIPYCG